MDNIQIWPAPKNINNLQKLLKFIDFYQNMIPKYSKWSSALTDLFQKKKKFEWGPHQALKSMRLKKLFVTNQPLTMHDFEKQIKLQTDASNKTVMG